MKRTRFSACCLALAVLVAALATVGSVTLAAQSQAPAAQAQPPAAGQGDFVPAKDLPPQETIPAAPLVMGAYAFVWAALLVYVWTVWRRLLRVEKEVRDLNARLASRPGAKR
jgi:CcmD family protein